MGDLLPYIWLGRELASRGHIVRITAGQAVQQLLPDTPLDVVTISDPFNLSSNEASQKLIESGSGKEFVKRMREQSSGRMQVFLDDCKNACDESDLILYANLGFAGPHIGEALGIPYFAVSLSPTLATGDYPAMNLREVPWPFRRQYNRFTHLYAERLFWKQIGSDINQWRKRSLNLKPVPWWGPFGRIRKTGYPFIYLISSSIFPRPQDWPEFAYMAGFQSDIADSSFDSNQFPLESFFEDGAPPIIVSLGPTWNNARQAKLDACLEAATSTGTRILICDPGATQPYEELGPGIIRVAFAHFPSILPKVMAVVHHGGAGSTYVCLLNQIPNVAYPSFGDQVVWAKCLQNLNAGPQAVPARKISAQSLIEDFVSLKDNNAAYRENLQVVADSLRAEQPMITAADLIERNYAAVISKRPTDPGGAR